MEESGEPVDEDKGEALIHALTNDEVVTLAELYEVAEREAYVCPIKAQRLLGL